MRGLQTVRTGELVGALGITPQQERELLSRLARRSLIARVRRGLYLVPPRLPPGGKWSPSEFLSLTTLMEDQGGRYQVCGARAPPLRLGQPDSERDENGTGPIKQNWVGSMMPCVVNIGPVPFFLSESQRTGTRQLPGRQGTVRRGGQAPLDCLDGRRVVNRFGGDCPQEDVGVQQVSRRSVVEALATKGLGRQVGGIRRRRTGPLLERLGAGRG